MKILLKENMKIHILKIKYIVKLGTIVIYAGK